MYKMKEPWMHCGWKFHRSPKQGCTRMLRDLSGEVLNTSWVVDSQLLQATCPSLGWICWSLPPPFLHFHLESSFNGIVGGIPIIDWSTTMHRVSECIPTLCTFPALHWSYCSLRHLDSMAFRQRTVSLYCVESNTKEKAGVEGVEAMVWLLSR